MNVNLHLHTNNSDGILEPLELLRKLEENNIKIASITDHDTVDTYSVLKNLDINKYFSGILIPGVEISCVHRGVPIEILAYNINIEKLKPFLDKNRDLVFKFQKYAFKHMIEVCKNLKLKFDEYELLPNEYAGGACFKLLSKYYDYNVKILGKDMMEGPNTFYRETLSNSKSPFYFSSNEFFPSAKEVIEKIHEVGGIAFIAHVGVYAAIKNKFQFLENLCETTDIDGVECYYYSFTEEETNQYIDFCHKHNLLISGGSDFHGTEARNTIFQDNININELTWVNYL